MILIHESLYRVTLTMMLLITNYLLSEIMGCYVKYSVYLVFFNLLQFLRILHFTKVSFQNERILEIFFYTVK